MIRFPFYQSVCAAYLSFATLVCYAQDQHVDNSKNITTTASVYKTELFNLIDPSGSQYRTSQGKAISKALDEALLSSGLNVATVRKRLLSGPAPQGELLQLEGGNKWLYGACQAHQCNTTNIAVFYDPKKQEIAGRLLYQCSTFWLGNPTDAEMVLINKRFFIDFNASDIKYICHGVN